jgi:ankyrin repeat protein
MSEGDYILHASDEDGYKAIHNAAVNGVSTEILDYLLEHKCDVNDTSNVGEETPLMLACIYGFPHLVQYLLQHGANAGRRDLYGELIYGLLD